MQPRRCPRRDKPFRLFNVSSNFSLFNSSSSYSNNLPILNSSSYIANFQFSIPLSTESLFNRKILFTQNAFTMLSKNNSFHPNIQVNDLSSSSSLLSFSFSSFFFFNLDSFLASVNFLLLKTCQQFASELLEQIRILPRHGDIILFSISAFNSFACKIFYHCYRLIVSFFFFF